MDQLRSTLTKSHLESMRAEFGMAYEKFAFANLVKRLLHNYNIRSVCEYPANDLMGNNSEAFVRFGCRVNRSATRHNNENALKKYDLAWSFCEFEKSEDPYDLVQKMMSLSKKYGLIVTQNKYNVLMYHRLYHLVKRKNWDHGFIQHMSSTSIVKVLEYFNFEKIEVGAFDVPWFVLDFYEGGSFVRRFAPTSLLNTQEMKESVLEKFPTSIKTLLAHHHYVLWEKSSS